MGIRGRLLALTLGVAIPLSLVGFVVLKEVWATSRRQLEHSLEQQAELGAIALERWLEAQREPLATVATFYPRRSRFAVEEDLQTVSLRRHWIDLRVINALGGVEAAYPVEARQSPPGLTLGVLIEVGRRRSWVVISEQDGGGEDRRVLTIGEPVASGGAVIGRVSASVVEELFREIELSDGAVIAAFDERGRLLYRSPSPESYAETEAGWSPLLAALEGRDTTFVEARSPYDGVRRVYGLARAGDSGGTLLVGTPSQVLYAPARHQLFRYTVFSAAALLCAVGAAVFVAGSISKPLRRLKASTRRLGAGDLRARASLTGVAEMDEVGVAFNQMATEIEERETRLGELDRLRSEFVSSVSHELRTPLTTIKALAHAMLRNGESKAERRQYLKTIARECDRQIDFVLNLFDLSRIEAGSYKISAERVSVPEVARACWLSRQKAAEARGQELLVALPADLPGAEADYGGLRRSLCALVDNAVKYTPDGGRIVLSARRDGDGVAISVADTGVGIAPEDTTRVFEKFYRGRPAAGRVVDSPAGVARPDFTSETGTGLGLYLALKIVEQMGGRLTVESEVGRGSTFTVRLKAWREEGSSGESEGEWLNV